MWSNSNRWSVAWVEDLMRRMKCSTFGGKDVVHIMQYLSARVLSYWDFFFFETGMEVFEQESDVFSLLLKAYYHFTKEILATR